VRWWLLPNEPPTSRRTGNLNRHGGRVCPPFTAGPGPGGRPPAPSRVLWTAETPMTRLVPCRIGSSPGVFTLDQFGVNRREVVTTFLRKSIFERDPTVARDQLRAVPVSNFRGLWKSLVDPVASLFNFDFVVANFHGFRSPHSQGRIAGYRISNGQSAGMKEILHPTNWWPTFAYVRVGSFSSDQPLPTLSACPLRSDRVRTFAPQRIDAVCHEQTIPWVSPRPSK
jgi:hypothetical protein